jgi:hypothetical protein
MPGERIARRGYLSVGVWSTLRNLVAVSVFMQVIEGGSGVEPARLRSDVTSATAPMPVRS